VYTSPNRYQAMPFDLAPTSTGEAIAVLSPGTHPL
jgi:hypothetical protein